MVLRALRWAAAPARRPGEPIVKLPAGIDTMSSHARTERFGEHGGAVSLRRVAHPFRRRRLRRRNSMVRSDGSRQQSPDDGAATTAPVPTAASAPMPTICRRVSRMLAAKRRCCGCGFSGTRRSRTAGDPAPDGTDCLSAIRLIASCACGSIGDTAITRHHNCSAVSRSPLVSACSASSLIGPRSDNAANLGNRIRCCFSIGSACV